jgi:hypothetical protein
MEITALQAVMMDYFLLALGFRFLWPLEVTRLEPDSTRLGLTPMRTLIASSKFSGFKETGFAFGIYDLPMASAIAHSSPHILSEHASAAARSASCYDIGKDVLILPVAYID